MNSHGTEAGQAISLHVCSSCEPKCDYMQIRMIKPTIIEDENGELVATLVISAKYLPALAAAMMEHLAEVLAR